MTLPEELERRVAKRKLKPEPKRVHPFPRLRAIVGRPKPILDLYVQSLLLKEREEMAKEKVIPNPFIV